MKISSYIYSFRYHSSERDLCRIESKYLFNDVDKDKRLSSNVQIEPSSSAFIKSRIDIIASSIDYKTLILAIKKEGICIEGFKVEYLVFDGDKTAYAERLNKLKDIGFSIEGIPDYYKPTITYALCLYEENWCFGVLVKNRFEWDKHRQKPCSYSNSISMQVAKALVNIASKGNKSTKLIDACCGVGTIMLEACFAGYNIQGCEINEKIFNDAQQNLSFFNYDAKVYHSDIKDIEKRYDAAIIDLPYNLLSSVTQDEIIHIIKSTGDITDRLIIVSTADIRAIIENRGFQITDHCSVSKKGKRSFARRIWVCEKN